MPSTHIPLDNFPIVCPVVTGVYHDISLVPLAFEVAHIFLFLSLL